VFRHACTLGLEGIVSKRLAAPYRSGPSRDWLKVKNLDGPAMRRARAGVRDFIFRPALCASAVDRAKPIVPSRRRVSSIPRRI